jgi:hypothetical protein
VRALAFASRDSVALIPEELLSILVGMIGAANRVVERGGVLTDPSGAPDGQAHLDVNRVPKTRRSPYRSTPLPYPGLPPEETAA